MRDRTWPREKLRSRKVTERKEPAGCREVSGKLRMMVQAPWPAASSQVQGWVLPSTVPVHWANTWLEGYFHRPLSQTWKCWLGWVPASASVPGLPWTPGQPGPNGNNTQLTTWQNLDKSLSITTLSIWHHVPWDFSTNQLQEAVSFIFLYLLFHLYVFYGKSFQPLLPFSKMNLCPRMWEVRHKEEIDEGPALPMIEIVVPKPYYCCVFIRILS